MKKLKFSAQTGNSILYINKARKNIIWKVEKQENHTFLENK